MLSRKRVTCFTQLCSDPKVDLKSEFVFKGKGTRTHVTPPQGVNYQWPPKGWYRIEQMVGIFVENRFAMYLLHDYSIYLMPEALFKNGTFLLLLVAVPLVIYRSMTQAVITIWKVVIGKWRWKYTFSFTELDDAYTPTFLGVASNWCSKRVQITICNALDGSED